MKELFTSIFRHISIHDAQLPYNLNWLSRNWLPAKPFLSAHPLVIFDVGARGDSLGELDRLKSSIEYYGFDADSEEAKATEARIKHHFHTCRIFPYFIGPKNGPMDFHLYKALGCSSSFLPGTQFAQFEVEKFSIDRTITVNPVDLDSVIATEHLPTPDLLKLDTQGSELNILKSAPKALASAMLVEVEVEFFPQYEGQPLFHDVAQYMYERGYHLLYLNRSFLGRQKYKGPTRGQLIFGDALFGKSDIEFLKGDLIRATKYMLLLMNYGHMDLAFEVLQRFPGIRESIRDVDQMFREHHHPRSKMLRALGMQLDKVISALLWARGTNQRRCDSDRSWPIR